MKIFMTGATGFIGSYVAHRFLDSGHRLVIVARNPKKTPSLSNGTNIKRIDGTIYDDDTIRSALAGADACVHVALGWGETPLTMLENDTKATVSLLQACGELGVGHFIYTSSTAVMGTFTPVMDESMPAAPIDLYGATKAAAEAYVLAAAATYNMQCNIIRPGYTFGEPVHPGAPTQPDQRFNNIVHNAARNETIAVAAGDGTQFIHASHLAALYESVLLSDRNREVYFGLAETYITWEAVAKEAIQLTGSRSPIEVEGTPTPPCFFDMAKIRAHFGLAFQGGTQITNHLKYLIETRDDHRR